MTTTQTTNNYQELPISEASKRNLSVLNLFGHKLADELGFEPHASIYRSKSVTVMKVRGKGQYKEKKFKVPTLDWETDCYRLQFIPSTTNCVELYWIEVKDGQECKGIGTKLINTILDIADEYGIRIKAIPCNFKNQGNVEDLYRLRDWYRSFGFRPSAIEGCVFYYTPKKNIKKF